MNEYERCLRIWGNWARSAPQEIESRLAHYHRSQAYHTIKIEYPELALNTATAMWDSGRMVNYTGPIQPVLAVSNYRIASAMAEACLESKEVLSVDLICGLQHALSCGLYDTQMYVYQEDRPGEFKQADSVNGLIDVGAGPEETEDALHELIESMPRIADLNDTLVAATYLHARVMFLKPFAVMNGVISRMVMNYWLRTQNYPPVLIPSGEAARYRKCLEVFDVQEDIEPLALFMSEKIADFWGAQMSQKEETKRNPVFTLRM